jgi:hypothetical protein
MAEPADDKLESVTVVSEGTLASVATVRSDVQEDCQENIEATSESFFQENTKKIQFDSVNLEDISASEYTDDDGDDEDDDDGIFKDNKQKRKRLKKKKPKHVVIEDDSSSDDEKTLVNENINPVFDTFFLEGFSPSPPPPPHIGKHFGKFMTNRLFAIFRANTCQPLNYFSNSGSVPIKS